LSTLGEDWIEYGNTNILVGDSADDWFGWANALSADGLTLAVGARQHENSAGLVRIYRKAGSSWSQIGGDIKGNKADENLGMSVSLSDDGNTVAVTAPYSDDNFDNSGQVKVFSYNSTAWVQLGQTINGKASDDMSGRSVSLSGNGETVAIGAHGPYNGIQTGRVRIYKIDTSSWVQQGDEIHGRADGDGFSWSVSLSIDGKTVAIGALWSDVSGNNSGQVEVYRYKNSIVWEPLGEVINGDAMGDEFGTSVSLSGDGETVAIGATGHNVNDMSNAGQVKVFAYNSTAWVQVGRDIDGDTADENSGYRVSLSENGRTVAIGSYAYDDSDRAKVGRVRVYGFDNPSWVLLGDPVVGEAVNDQLGRSVSLSHDGSILAIGAIMENGGGSDSGRVGVYTRVSTVGLSFTIYILNINSITVSDRYLLIIHLSIETVMC
jgi:hypothetical protein